MEYTIETLPKKLIAGPQIRTTNEDGQSAKDLATFWADFDQNKTLNKISNPVSGEIIGLYCDYECDHTGAYTVVAGCEVSKREGIHPPFTVKEVPASKYAVFEIKGPFPNKLMETWDWIWDCEKLQRTFSFDFELYPVDFNPKTNPILYLHIAVK